MNSITGNLWILRYRYLKIKPRDRRPKTKASGRSSSTLMKIHIHGIEKRNQEDPFLRLDIDWVLDELGLEELKRSLGKQ